MHPAAALEPVDRAVGPDRAVQQHVRPGIGHRRAAPARRTRPGRRGGWTPSSPRRCRRRCPAPCRAWPRGGRPRRCGRSRSSQFHVPSCAASSASSSRSCSRRSSTTLRSLTSASAGVAGGPGCPIVTDAGGSPPTIAVRCTGAVTEPARRRPFRGWLRSLRRSAGPGARARPPRGRRHPGGEGDRRRARAAGDQRAARRRRACGGGLPRGSIPTAADGSSRRSPTRFGADPGTLDRAVDTHPRRPHPGRAGPRRAGPPPGGGPPVRRRGST